MKKQNKTSSTPLNWWFGPAKDVVGYYVGTSIVQAGDMVTLNKTDLQVHDITYSFNTGWAPMDIGVVWPDFKKTLNVTKKEDIKFD